MASRNASLPMQSDLSSLSPSRLSPWSPKGEESSNPDVSATILRSFSRGRMRVVGIAALLRSHKVVSTDHRGGLASSGPVEVRFAPSRGTAITTTQRDYYASGIILVERFFPSSSTE